MFFSPHELTHVYRDDEFVSRKWGTVTQYVQGESRTLKQAERDLYNCFCYTGVPCECPTYPDCIHISRKVIDEIFDTPMPPIKQMRRVYGYDWTKMLGGPESRRLELSVAEPHAPKTYYDLFKIIGVREGKCVGERDVYEYPDSVHLLFVVFGDIIYYAYTR